MVGVPGRSKACHNCRQRRIRCGGERPGCHNCAKSIRSCAGYQRKHAFILSKDMVISEPEWSEGLPPLIDEADSGTVLVSRWRIDQDKPPRSISNTTAFPVQTYIPTLQDISPHNAFREKLMGVFLDYHLPLEAIDSTRPAVKQRNWLLLILDLPTLTPALEHAVLALCTARLGRYNDLQALVHESLYLYTSSLRELRRAVLDPVTRCNEQNIAACMALAMYEISECPGRMIEGYMSHYNGAMKLLRLRGADAHTSGLAHSLFQSLRRHSIFYGLRQRSTTFLNEPNWRELPWASCPTQKAHLDKLLDILLEIPDLFAQFDALEATICTQETLLKTLETILESLRMDSCLADWFINFEATVAGPMYYPGLSRISSTADSPELGKVFSVAFNFPAFGVAQTLVFYWIALLIVRGHMCIMYEKLAGFVALLDTVNEDVSCTCGDDSNDSAAAMTCLRHFAIDLLPPLGHRMEWFGTPARNICQSVEYFLQDQMRGEGPLTMLPALAVVKGCWGIAPGDWGRETLWIDDMVGKIQDKGNEIAGYI